MKITFQILILLLIQFSFSQIEIDTTEVDFYRTELMIYNKSKDTIVRKIITKYKSGLFKIEKDVSMTIMNIDFVEPTYTSNRKAYLHCSNINGNNEECLRWYMSKSGIDSITFNYQNPQKKSRTVIPKIKKNIFGKVIETELEEGTTQYRYNLFGKLKSRKHTSSSTGIRKKHFKKGLVVKEEINNGENLYFYDKKSKLIKITLNGEKDYFTYEYDSKNRVKVRMRIRNNRIVDKIEYFFKENKLIREDYYSYKIGDSIESLKPFRYKSHIYSKEKIYDKSF